MTIICTIEFDHTLRAFPKEIQELYRVQENRFRGIGATLDST